MSLKDLENALERLKENVGEIMKMPEPFSAPLVNSPYMPLAQTVVDPGSSVFMQDFQAQSRFDRYGWRKKNKKLGELIARIFGSHVNILEDKSSDAIRKCVEFESRFSPEEVYGLFLATINKMNISGQKEMVTMLDQADWVYEFGSLDEFFQTYVFSPAHITTKDPRNWVASLILPREWTDSLRHKRELIEASWLTSQRLSEESQGPIVEDYPFLYGTPQIAKKVITENYGISPFEYFNENLVDLEEQAP